jgi:predicted MPP superfamily phosphohydrolase
VQNRRYVSGEVSVDAARTLYISRGVGHMIRARFNVRPEITLFTLRAAGHAATSLPAV